MEFKILLETGNSSAFGTRAFPTLIEPEIATQDSNGYLKAIAQAAVQQIRFLNAYAGIPLTALYTHSGTLSDADGLQSITNLWTAQNNLLTQQNAYLDDIKTTFQEKREDLNVGFSIKQFTQSNTFKFLADMAVKKVTDWVTDAFPGVADDAILDTIAKYAPRAIGWGIVWLHKQFLAGAILCERMKEENTQLLALTASIEMYKMRSDIISQHDLTIQNLLSQVALVETQIGSGSNADLAQILDGALYATYDPKIGWKRNAGLAEHINRALFFKDKEGLNEDIGLAALIKELIDLQQGGESSAEPVIQCPHTGDFIFSHSRGKMTKV